MIQSEKVSLGELTPPRMKAEACCGLRGRYLGIVSRNGICRRRTYDMQVRRGAQSQPWRWGAAYRHAGTEQLDEQRQGRRLSSGVMADAQEGHAAGAR